MKNPLPADILAACDQLHANADQLLDDLVRSVRDERVLAHNASLGASGGIAFLTAYIDDFLVSRGRGARVHVAMAMGAAVYRLSTAPTSLAERMLAAADTLEEASKLYQAYNPAKYSWSAEELRREAPHVAHAKEAGA